MRKSFFEFSKDLTSKSIYDSLSLEEQEIIKSFKEYNLITASEGRTEEAIREVLRFREVIGKPLNHIDLEDLRYFLKELKQKDFADYTKNKIKGFIQRFLRWEFKDWSERFDNFIDLKINTMAQRKKPITSKEILSKEEIEKLVRSEPSNFWKAFLIVQWEGGLRTGEARKLEWDRVTFEDDDFISLKIPSKKNKNGTITIREIPLKESTIFLKELREQQRTAGINTPYVFPSPKNHNKPVSKSVNAWFGDLTKKVLGRRINNYLLRHTRGTELKKLIKEGSMSKDNATEFLGHSEKMFDRVYSHMDKEDVKQLMKKQIYKFKEIPEEKKHELEREIDLLKQNQDDLLKAFDNVMEYINKDRKETGITKAGKEEGVKILLSALRKK